MRKRDKELLQSAESVVQLSKHMPGSGDPHARYDSKHPDSLGVLMEWYYRDAGKILGGSKFDKNRYDPR